MLEELQRRNYAQSTAKQYIRIVREFAKHYGKAPDQLGPDQIREYSAYLFRERKLDDWHGTATRGCSAFLLHARR